MPAVEYTRFAQHCRHIYESPRYSPRTREKMVSLIPRLAELGARSTLDLTTDLFREYVAWRSGEVNNNTIRGELTYLRTLVNEAIDQGWLKRAPKWKRLWPPRCPRRRKVLHSIEDVCAVDGYLRARATTWAGLRDYALFTLVAHTGLRLKEACLRLVSELNLERGSIEVTDALDRVKTPDSAAVVLIPRAATPVLREWRSVVGSMYLFPVLDRSRPWISGGVGHRPTDRLKAAADAAGVKGMTYQSLRHTFATWATWEFGLRAKQLQVVLRHTTEETQAAYVHRPHRMRRLERAVDRIDWHAALATSPVR